MKRFIAAGIGLLLAVTATAVYANGPAFTTKVIDNSFVGGYHHVCEPADGRAAKHHDLQVVIPAAAKPQEQITLNVRVWSNNEGVHGKPTALVGGKRRAVHQDFNTLRQTLTLPDGNGFTIADGGGYQVTLPFEVHHGGGYEEPEIVNITVIARDAAAERWLGKKRQWIGQIKIWDYQDCQDGLKPQG